MNLATANSEIENLETEIGEKLKRLAELKRSAAGENVTDFSLKNNDGEVKLSSLFGEKKDLIVIHNMGTGCPYCTLWADGFNGLYQHFADRAAFAVVSPDNPEVQQKFAEQRGWRFPMYSAEDSDFTKEMGFDSLQGPLPGVSTFHKTIDGIELVAQAPFGPFDPFCSIWHIFAFLKDGISNWGPKYNYKDSTN